MNTAELQMIVDMVNQLGDKGLLAFCLWLTFQYLIPPIAWFVTLYVFVKHIGVPLLGLNSLYSYFQDVRDRCHLGISGPLNSKEIKAVKNHIDRLLERTNQ